MSAEPEVRAETRTADEEASGDAPADGESRHRRSRGVSYISWAASCSRSDHTARELGGVSHLVYLGWLGSHPLTVPFKYAGQFFASLWLLLWERPRAVCVMSPPVFAVLPVYLWSLFTRRPFVIDAHTAAFHHPRWKRLQWLQDFFSRRAATTIVHNEHLARHVRARGGDATLLRDVPVVYPAGATFELGDRFAVAVVASFNPDEPVEAIFEAARRVSDVDFFVTGDPRFLDPELRERCPENVRLTGFLSDEKYGALIRGAGAVLTLTTRDHTMLRGAWEAIYQATPVIVSDWPVLRESFDEGAITVDNSAEAIAEAVRRARREREPLRAGAARLRERKLAAFAEAIERLRERIG